MNGLVVNLMSLRYWCSVHVERSRVRCDDIKLNRENAGCYIDWMLKEWLAL